MIPKDLIEVTHGMSIITSAAYCATWVVIGYIMKGCKDAKKCYSVKISGILEEKHAIQTDLAVCQERFKSIQDDIKEIKESTVSIHKRLNSITDGK